MNLDIDDVRRRPYRIQGVNAAYKDQNFEGNKAYCDYASAVRGASTQAQNAVNVKNGNAFIVYKAVAYVAPIRSPIEVTTI
jgi:hypothetical protein